jgi:hypothetical protein
MQRIDTARVIIVGAGLGALFAALKLAPRPVLVISPERLGEGASSAWAQGGVAAAMDPADSAEAHARDTLRAGAGSVDPEVARRVTEEARAHILDLTDLGTPFDRSDTGGYVLSREAAHSFARVVRIRGDQAGAGIMQALVAQVRATPSIQVLEGVMATGLHLEAGQVSGVALARCDGGLTAPCLLRAPALLLAGGGSGGLYALTTNPPPTRPPSTVAVTPPRSPPRRCVARARSSSTATASASWPPSIRMPSLRPATSSPARSMPRPGPAMPRRSTPAPPCAARRAGGAHFRADFPAPSGPDGHRSFLTLAEARTPRALETT